MTLIKCKECGEVRNTAETCPKCGETASMCPTCGAKVQIPKKTSISTWIISGLVIWFLYVYFSGAFDRILITGSSSVPSCSDVRVLGLLNDTIENNRNLEGQSMAMYFDISHTVTSIQTLSTSNQTGAHECTAILTITSKVTDENMVAFVTMMKGRVDNNAQQNLNYRVSLTDDNKEIVLNVHP